MPETAAGASVRRLTPALRQDFFRLHAPENGCGWCLCVAWWVPTWDGWGDRSVDMNRSLRQALFRRGEDDGYLAYVEGEPVGWIQVGPRDRLEKLVEEYQLTPDPKVWAITCLLTAPRARGAGWAHRMVDAVLADLPERGATAVEAFPRTGRDLSADAIWTGSERLFLAHGFHKVQDHPRRPRYRRPVALAGPRV